MSGGQNALFHAPQPLHKTPFSTYFTPMSSNNNDNDNNNNNINKGCLGNAFLQTLSARYKLKDKRV